ncbi:MAG: NF038122 family metalloprotease, partial [Hyphomicrobiales bacterium]
MIINLEYDNNALLAPQSFRDGMQAAANAIDAAFVDNITINIAVGYGEFLGGLLDPNNPNNQNLSVGNIDYQGSLNSTVNDGTGFNESYSTLRALLASHATSADDNTAVANLPNTATLQGQGVFTIGSAQAKALGLLAGNNGALDGAVGMGTAFTGDVLFNGALHELTHAMGRIAGDSLDLFRFNEDGSGNHVFGFGIPATPAYFSIDGGATKLADFGINSDPGDFLNTGIQGPDPFNETIGGASMTAADLTLMDVMGFTRSAASFQGPNGAPNPDFNTDHKADLLW